MVTLAKRVCRDDRSSLAKTITLIHRHTYGVEEALQLRVEQCTTTYEELKLSTKGKAHLAEENLVEEGDKWLEDKSPTSTLCISVLIVLIAHLEGKLEEFLGSCTLALDRALDILAEVLCKCRYREQEVRLNLVDICRDITQCLHRSCAYLCSCNGSTARNHNIETADMCKAVIQRQDNQCTEV